MRYLLCISNKGYEVSLEPRKIYQSLPDGAAQKRGYVRIVDESGEGYIFPADYFEPIEVSQKAKRRLEEVAA